MTSQLMDKAKQIISNNGVIKVYLEIKDLCSKRCVCPGICKLSTKPVMTYYVWSMKDGKLDSGYKLTKFQAKTFLTSDELQLVERYENAISIIKENHFGKLLDLKKNDLELFDLVQMIKTRKYDMQII